MKLIVQPRDGWSEFLSAIRQAKKEIDLVIFRFDRPEIAKALDAAIKRGVVVRTLIAHTNRGGEKNLRKLEQRFLETGAIVARTGDEFVRYHGKLMVVDRSVLWLMCFNLTALDVGRSRSFAVVTRQRSDVQQALKLFDADATRQPFEPSPQSQLVVSPENARAVLSDYIRKARKQLLIYDPKVSDGAIIKLLKDHVKSGLDVRIIGKVSKGANDVLHEKYPGKRLHARVIIRDHHDAFLGSQSLRKLELDKRREVGILVKDQSVIAELAKTFEEDWALTDSGKRAAKRREKEKEKSDEAALQQPA
jgi:phosphatidylserine/phosphatidylglycerophosphate/cardiolipin synthase-like enzyme